MQLYGNARKSLSNFSPEGDGAEKDDIYLHIPQPSKETIDLMLAQLSVGASQRSLSTDELSMNPITTLETAPGEGSDIKYAMKTLVQDEVPKEDLQIFQV